MFGSHDQSGPFLEIHGRVVKVGMRGCRQDLNFVFAKPGQNFIGGGFHNRKGEEGSRAGANDVGIVDVGATVADDHRVDPGGIGRSEDGAEVPGLFNGFGHDQ